MKYLNITAFFRHYTDNGLWNYLRWYNVSLFSQRRCIFLAVWQRPSTDEMAGIFQKLIDEEAMEANCLQGARDSRPATADEREIFKLAQDFLAHPEETPDEACLIRLSKAWIPLGDCALQVSEIIDSL